MFENQMKLEMVLDKLGERGTLKYIEELPWESDLLKEAMEAGYICLLRAAKANGTYQFVVPEEIESSGFSCCSILLFKRNGMDITKENPGLRLVNALHPVSMEFSPKVVPVPSDPTEYSDVICVNALERMLSDCRSAGLKPYVCSGFRSVQAQIENIIESIQSRIDEGMSPEEAKADANRYLAQPGCSEHHLGTAFDILSMENRDMIESQEKEPEQQWLVQHCAEYGFVLRYPKGKEDITGIIYEPWHYRFVGRIHALIMKKTGLTLEEYTALLH